MKRLFRPGAGRVPAVRGLAVAGLMLVGGGGLAAIATTAQAAAGCSVSYSVNQWSTGFTANLSVTNLGDPITNGWKLEFDYAGNQTVNQSWNSVHAQSGRHVTLTSADWNKSLGTNATVSPGFNATYSGSNAAPTGFTLNGVACTGGVGPTSGPTPTRTTSPTPSASPSPTRSVSPSASPTRSTPPSPTPSIPPGNGGGGPSTTWPTKRGDFAVSGTINVSGVLDGEMRRYCCIGDGSGSESQDPMFKLAPGATLQNVIIGAPAGDGVHCANTCTLKNVWWEDVGEDAATMLGTAPAGSIMTIDGGGARKAGDKVFQHNGRGTMIIKNFFVDDFGKLYRSCGNCSETSGKYQGPRNVVMDNIVAQAGRSSVVGINDSYTHTSGGDTARLSRITILGDPNKKLEICQRFTGNNSGKEPPKSGSGPSANCIYSASDITYK